MGGDMLDYGSQRRKAELDACRVGRRFVPAPPPWEDAGWRVYDNLLGREVGGGWYGEDGDRRCHCECERRNTRTGDGEALEKAVLALEELRAAVRWHRDQRGDDRCWLDDERLYAMLPEGYAPPARDCAVELSLCDQFIRHRHRPGTTYVSPQRRIEELEAETVRLRQEVIALQNRGEPQ